jgi:hypothetical protein
LCGTQEGGCPGQFSSSSAHTPLVPASDGATLGAPLSLSWVRQNQLPNLACRCPPGHHRRGEPNSAPPAGLATVRQRSLQRSLLNPVAPTPSPVPRLPLTTAPAHRGGASRAARRRTGRPSQAPDERGAEPRVASRPRPRATLMYLRTSVRARLQSMVAPAAHRRCARLGAPMGPGRACGRPPPGHGLGGTWGGRGPSALMPRRLAAEGTRAARWRRRRRRLGGGALEPGAAPVGTARPALGCSAASSSRPPPRLWSLLWPAPPGESRARVSMCPGPQPPPRAHARTPARALARPAPVSRPRAAGWALGAGRGGAAVAALLLPPPGN